ncbi:MAG: NUDIX domain-containing protein [Pseudomonadota bacterium]
MTLGVRVAAFNDADEVLLVRHTYIEGWHLPGGAVERGESVGAAARKELQEEANIVPKDDGALTLFAVYKNEIMSRFDHVVLFVLQGANQTAPKLPDSEIEEARFFACDALPEGTTEPTRRRLVEIAGRTAPRALW